LKMKELETIGESGLIRQIRNATRVSNPAVLIGIGDDTAVIRGCSKKDILFTTDMLVEGVHFRLSEASSYQIGRKALAVNLSDIAAMGGWPTVAVVAVGLPPNLSLKFVRDLYRGMRDLASCFHVAIVGGDTNRSEKLVLSVALLGEVKKNKAIRRSGAECGDVIFVTGPLGGSYTSKKHLNFIPRLKESRFLTRHFKIHAMMDLSDGLASDIHRLCEESGVGAILSREAIPTSPFAKNRDAALSDGEDFELLFTLSPKEAARLTLYSLERNIGPFWPVGKIVSKRQGIKITEPGRDAKDLLEKGFDHFK